MLFWFILCKGISLVHFKPLLALSASPLWNTTFWRFYSMLVHLYFVNALLLYQIQYNTIQSRIKPAGLNWLFSNDFWKKPAKIGFFQIFIVNSPKIQKIPKKPSFLKSILFCLTSMMTLWRFWKIPRMKQWLRIDQARSIKR